MICCGVCCSSRSARMKVFIRHPLDMGRAECAERIRRGPAAHHLLRDRGVEQRRDVLEVVVGFQHGVSRFHGLFCADVRVLLLHLMDERLSLRIRSRRAADAQDAAHFPFAHGVFPFPNMVSLMFWNSYLSSSYWRFASAAVFFASVAASPSTFI